MALLAFARKILRRKKGKNPSSHKNNNSFFNTHILHFMQLLFAHSLVNFANDSQVLAIPE